MPTIKEMFEASKNVPHDFRDHMDKISEYAHGKTIVELGTRTGNSTLAFLRGSPEWMRSYDIKVLPEACEIRDQAKREGINYDIYEADDLKIEISPCDILFIDTDHIDRQLRQELALHADKAKHWIILHDITTFGFFPERNGQPDKGMAYAVVNFLDEHPEWFVKDCFHNCHGLLVLERAV